MKQIFALIFALVVLLGSVKSVLAIGTTPPCKTKYPIVLVHGAFFKDENMLGINYWWGIPSALEDEGATVYVTNQDTFNGIIERANQVVAELAEQFALNPTWKKVNLIGHSMGPLDCRYIISNMSIPGKGLAKNYIASLTSISGTHRGSQVADLLWNIYKGLTPVIGPELGDAIASAVNAFASIFYYNEQDQNSMLLLYSLTSDYVTNVFNPLAPNVSNVYYQSWAGKVKFIGLNIDQLIVAPLWTIMNLMGAGDNDCLVSVESAKWGNFRGIIQGAWWSDGISHFNEIGHFFGDTPGFDAPQFYVDIVKELKNKGY
jgi:triacylglycerol lipase